MPIEVSTDKVICPRCGLAYNSRRNNFFVSYAESHKGIGYVPVCKNCINDIYSKYLSQCDSQKDAVRQTCRKLDLYWNPTIFESVLARSSNRTIMSQYISRINGVSYAGKSYDDTLLDEGRLWNFDSDMNTNETNCDEDDEDDEVEPVSYPPASEEVKAFWGPGYTDEMYALREQRRKHYMSKFPEGTELDVGSEALLRQLCNLEVDIARDSASGKSIDKSVNSFNTLLGSLNLKPAQRKEDTDNTNDKTPFGVWIRKWENDRPIPEVDPELEDADSIKWYITVFFFGHLCKMLNIKNSYCKLYEDEIEKMRIERPELDDEDDDTLLYDVLSENSDDPIDG